MQTRILFAVVGAHIAVLPPCISMTTAAQFAPTQSSSYADQFARLNEEYSLLQNGLGELWKQSSGMSNSLSQAIADAQSIQVAGAQQEMLTAFNAMQQSRLGLINSEIQTRPNRDSNRTERQWAGAAYSASLIKYLIEASRLSQLYSAQKSTNERYRKLFGELNRLNGEIRKNMESQRDLFEKYRRLADVFGMRSGADYRAALGTLENSHDGNLGAKYAYGLMLRRLGEFETAEKEFAARGQQETPYKALFLSARAEVRNAMGDQRQALQSIGVLSRLGDQTPEVFVYGGLIHAINGSEERAISYWRRALNLGVAEMELRRNLAILMATDTHSNPNERREALEQAEIASQLSLNESWSVEAALAIALAANGRKDEALSKIQEAAALTDGECQIYCEQILKAIENDESFEWDFLKH